MVEKNKMIMIDVLISIFIIICGIIGVFFIHNTASNKVTAKPSKLGNTYSLKKDISKELKTIIHESQKCVVCIEVENEEGTALGSGFLYNDKGDIITNAHVVEGASIVTVKMADTTVYKGTVIGRSSTTDVALVRVPELINKTYLKVVKDRKVDVGDEVIALGSPLGLQNTVTTGIISGLNRDFDIENYKYKRVYQISAPISPGNSGGPLLDKKTGEVLGINSAKVGQENIGFSIPVNQILSLVNNWSQNPCEELDKSSQNKFNNKQNVSREDCEYLVYYFYNSLNSKDYVTAYSLLGSNWQTNQSYKEFRQGYLNTISVEVESMITKKTQEGIEIVAIIEATEKSEDGDKLSKYKVNYNINTENGVLKILSGKGKSIS